jgi:hypothetical protein
MTTAEGVAAGTLRADRSAATGEYQVVRNFALFFAAPFIGLAYIILMPLAGFGALGTFMVKAALAER